MLVSDILNYFPEEILKILTDFFETETEEKLKTIEEIRLRVGQPLILKFNKREEIFKYNVEVNYLDSNYYKVDMVNKANEHKQIILRNNDGLYVITPSLNKSFKFESTWPDNSSQSYILSSLIKDIKNDNNKEISKNEDGYIIKTTVNYPNNEELKYQKIYLS